ncbi:MAG: hypothetical protein QOE90_40 [Thermoplasmata archaeon]|jgi:hypothetical protein|nr:hypothetical protein [Thermoplasmata archaeon]
MMRVVPLVLALAAAFATFVPAAQASAGDRCVEYAYVADYNWYYVCAGTQGDCLVYQKHVSGVTETRTCYASTQTGTLGLTYCSPYAGDMDHMFRLCVSARQTAACAVYEEFQNDGSVKCLA